MQMSFSKVIWTQILNRQSRKNILGIYIFAPLNLPKENHDFDREKDHLRLQKNIFFSLPYLILLSLYFFFFLFHLVVCERTYSIVVRIYFCAQDIFLVVLKCPLISWNQPGMDVYKAADITFVLSSH